MMNEKKHGVFLEGEIFNYVVIFYNHPVGDILIDLREVRYSRSKVYGSVLDVELLLIGRGNRKLNVNSKKEVFHLGRERPSMKGV